MDFRGEVAEFGPIPQRNSTAQFDIHCFSSPHPHLRFYFSRLTPTRLRIYIGNVNEAIRVPIQSSARQFSPLRGGGEGVHFFTRTSLAKLDIVQAKIHAAKVNMDWPAKHYTNYEFRKYTSFIHAIRPMLCYYYS
jgi:hypothetical protein